MDWSAIRAHFEDLMTARGSTQEQIAEAGGLSGQNAISRLLTNQSRGPSVETFIRALEGLGVAPSRFFADLETSSSGRAYDRVAVPVLDPQIIEVAIREVFLGLERLLVHQQGSPAPSVGTVPAACADHPDPASRDRVAHRRRARTSA
jgi:transcriptional regulator with XRE-family HTH domain